MQPGKYTVKALFTDRNIVQIIVPEIQRDYIWGTRQVNELINSLKDDYLKKLTAYAQDPIVSSLPSEAKEMYVKQKYSSNIGFIYAYNDPEYANKYFLIDGQQRLTTIYLLLLLIYIKCDKCDEFRQRYYRDNVLKIDYKVREASHTFLECFFDNLLNKLEIDRVEDQYWFFSDYKNDVTIYNLVNNYRSIDNLLSEWSIDYSDFMQHIENYIEFWYYDTSISEQGEELYIYMNSRGETVQPSENIKATLLEVIENLPDKLAWGRKWEEWQDFFWKNRVDNENADKGFNAFLQWIQLIEIMVNDHENKYNNINNIRKLEEEVQYNKYPSLTLSTIEKYFMSFKTICIDTLNKSNFIEAIYNKYGKILNYEVITNIKSWCRGDDITVYKISLLSLLYYCKEFSTEEKLNGSEIEWQSIYRITRFLYNITRFDNVTKTPYNSYRNSLMIVRELVNNDLSDIADIVKSIENNKFSPSETVLSREQVLKFYLFRKSSTFYTREQIEQSFWDAEDNKYLNGDLTFLFECIGIDPKDKNTFVNWDYEKFNHVKNIFIELFTIDNDLRIRALLTKGDYSIYEGTNPSIGGERYFLGYNIEDWRRILTTPSSSLKVKELISDIMTYPNSMSIVDVLNEIIKKYLDTSRDRITWIYKLIKHPEAIEYCRYKRVCVLTHVEVYLLVRRVATSGYYELESFISNLTKTN